MQKQGLIEKLEDLAIFLTLEANNASTRRKESKTIMGVESVAFWEGKENAFNTISNKIDKIIKEAK